MSEVKRTERGWAGHYCLADRCIFRRNTLLEFEEKKIVVSTVGALVNIHAEGWPNNRTFMEISPGRYYETMAFWSDLNDEYFDADISRQINFESPWNVKVLENDKLANTQHDAVVEELAGKLLKGEL